MLMSPVFRFSSHAHHGRFYMPPRFSVCAGPPKTPFFPCCLCYPPAAVARARPAQNLGFQMVHVLPPIPGPAKTPFLSLKRVDPAPHAPRCTPSTPIYSETLRATPSYSQPLRATASGGRPRTPSYSELLQGTSSCCSELSEPHQELRATQSQSELLQCFRAAPSYSEHSELRCSPSCSELHKWEYHRSGKPQKDDTPQI